MPSYKRPGDQQVIEQAGQIGDRFQRLGEFIGNKNATRQNLEYAQGQENQRQQNQIQSQEGIHNKTLQAESERQAAGFTQADKMEQEKVKAEQDLKKLEHAYHESEAGSAAQRDIAKQHSELSDKINQIKSLQKENPNSTVEGGGIKIDSITPALKTTAESKDIYGEFDKQTKEDQAALKSSQLIKENIDHPTPLSGGIIQSEMARMALPSSGRIPQQEFGRIFPSSLKQDVTKGANYFGLGKFLPSSWQESAGLTDIQKQLVGQSMQNVDKSARANIERSRSSLMQAGPQIAPMMSRQGSLSNFVGNLGTNSPGQLPMQQPAQPAAPVQQPTMPQADPSYQRYQELMRKKNGAQ